MSLPFFCRWAHVAVFSLVALGGTAFAQSGMKSDGSVFLEAVRDSDGAKIMQMVREPGASTLVNARDITTGDTALHLVAKRRDAEYIRFLSANGANPNIANKDDVTPLMISTRLGHIEGVTALLKAGAQVDPLSATGETPLIFAVHRRDVPLIRVLLANGANPDHTDNSGRSARDYIALIAERRLTEAFEAAEISRNESAAQQYGPSL